MNIRHDHRLAAIALLSFGCSVSVPEPSRPGIRTRANAPLLFVTGQGGTHTVTLRAAEANGTGRILAKVELDVPLLVPIDDFDYDHSGDFFQSSSSGLLASPDGSAVLFLHDGTAEVLDVADGRPAAFSPLKEVASWPEWSPDGSRLAYEVRSGHQLLTADRATGKVSVAIDFGGACLDSFEWSPDGKHLAYLLKRQDDCSGPAEFHVVTATGTGDRLVHPDALFCGGALTHPASVWSADSAHVAFVVPSGEPLSGTVKFQTARADGSGSTTVLERPASEYEPTVCEWSPRTNWLAISGRTLQVLRPDGSELDELDSPLFSPDVAAAAFTSLSWAPDGEHLARVSQDGDSPLLRTFRPALDNADENELSAKLVYSGSPCCVSFEWGPDGKHAAYLLPHDTTPEGVYIGFGAEPHLWTAEDGTDERLSSSMRPPAFNTDGSRVVYGADAWGEPRSRPVDGGPVAIPPPYTQGWVSEDVIAVVHGGKIFVDSVDGKTEKWIWGNTPDQWLLSVRVPRPFIEE